MAEEVNWLLEIGQMTVPFVLGLLFRKKAGRIILKAKKWILNDIVTLDLLAVREYPKIVVKEIELSVFDNIKNKISNAQLVQSYPNGIIIKLNVFGNLISEIEKIYDEETNECESVKLILKTETPIRLTIRELKKLRQFEKYADNIFDSIEKQSFPPNTNFNKSYAICDLTRSTTFSESQTFNKKDDNLNAIINGDEDKLTIRVSPMDTIAEATEKYHLV